MRAKQPKPEAASWSGEWRKAYRKLGAVMLVGGGVVGGFAIGSMLHDVELNLRDVQCSVAPSPDHCVYYIDEQIDIGEELEQTLLGTALAVGGSYLVLRSYNKQPTRLQTGDTHSFMRLVSERQLHQ